MSRRNRCCDEKRGEEGQGVALHLLLGPYAGIGWPTSYAPRSGPFPAKPSFTFGNTQPASTATLFAFRRKSISPGLQVCSLPKGGSTCSRMSSPLTHKPCGSKPVAFTNSSKLV